MQEQTTISAIEELKPWFHNLHLSNGAQTAPDHPLGDFPANKWRQLASHLLRILPVGQQSILAVMPDSIVLS